MEKLGIRGYASIDYALVGFAKRSDYIQIASYTYGQNIGKTSGILDMNLSVDVIFEAIEIHLALEYLPALLVDSIYGMAVS